MSPSRLVLRCVVALVVTSASQAQTANPLANGARLHYGIIKGDVTRAAAKMPDEHYAFRPAPEVRSSQREGDRPALI